MTVIDKVMMAKAERAWQRYLSRRLPTGLEPDWTHPDYQLVRDWLDGKTIDEGRVRELLDSFDVPDGTLVESLPGFPAAGRVLIEDGWKVGTTSWVFERRSECNREVYRGWVVLSRVISSAILSAAGGLKFPDIERLWMAFLPRLEKGFAAYLPGIGPCTSRDEMITLIDFQKYS